MENKQNARTKKDTTLRHPWLQLLEMEQQSTTTFIKSEKQRGRPKRRFPRDNQSTIRFTQGEEEALDGLLELFRKHINPSVVRADVIAFMSYRLIDEIKALGGTAGKTLTLPPEVNSFTSLGEYLDGQRGASEPTKRAAKAKTDKGEE